MKKDNVYLIEHNLQLASTIQTSLNSTSCAVENFSSASDFLASYQDTPGCLVCNIRLPDVSGLALQRNLKQLNYRIPIIFITNNNDANTAVTAIKKGAFDFLVCPFNLDYLFDTVNQAIKLDSQQRAMLKVSNAFDLRIKSLTPREQQVMKILVNGKVCKEIAKTLNISPATVEVHCSKIKKKLGTKSTVEIVNKLHLLDRMMASSSTHSLTQSTYHLRWMIR